MEFFLYEKFRLLFGIVSSYIKVSQLNKKKEYADFIPTFFGFWLLNI